MAISPHTHPDIYRSINVNGTDSPGVVTLSGYPREQQWEEQKAKGTAGSTDLNRGRKNSGFTASFYLVDTDDLDGWDSFQRMLTDSVDGPKPKALLITHPDLLRNKVLDFVVQSIGDMTWDGKGGATIVCKFREYRPAKPKPAVKAEAGKAGGGAANAVAARTDPNAARKAELAALLEQAKQP